MMNRRSGATVSVQGQVPKQSERETLRILARHGRRLEVVRILTTPREFNPNGDPKEYNRLLREAVDFNITPEELDAAWDART